MMMLDGLDPNSKLNVVAGAVFWYLTVHAMEAQSDPDRFKAGGDMKLLLQKAVEYGVTEQGVYELLVELAPVASSRLAARQNRVEGDTDGKL